MVERKDKMMGQYWDMKMVERMENMKAVKSAVKKDAMREVMTACY